MVWHLWQSSAVCLHNTPRTIVAIVLYQQIFFNMARTQGPYFDEASLELLTTRLLQSIGKFVTTT